MENSSVLSDRCLICNECLVLTYGGLLIQCPRCNMGLSAIHITAGPDYDYKTEMVIALHRFQREALTIGTCPDCNTTSNMFFPAWGVCYSCRRKQIEARFFRPR
jgi:hypothetical protein